MIEWMSKEDREEFDGQLVHSMVEWALINEDQQRQERQRRLRLAAEIGEVST